MAKTERLSNLLRKMAALPDATRKSIGEALEQGAEEIAAAQRRLAPKKTGALAQSITITKGAAKVPKYAALGRAGDGASDLTIAITAGNEHVRYAHLVEFSSAPHENKGLYEGSQHPGTKAQSFFFPPYRALRKRVKARVTRATRKAARAAASAST